jgi:hypothetical protein
MVLTQAYIPQPFKARRFPQAVELLPLGWTGRYLTVGRGAELGGMA